MRVFVIIQWANTCPSPAGIFDMVCGGDADKIHCTIIHHFFDNTVRKLSNLHPVSHGKTVCGCAGVLCCVAGFLVRVAIRSAFLRSFLRNDFFCAHFSHCSFSFFVLFIFKKCKHSRIGSLRIPSFGMPCSKAFFRKEIVCGIYRISRTLQL